MIFNVFHSSSLKTATWILASVLLFSQGVASAQLLDRVVAVVNDDIITLSEMEDSGKELMDQVRQSVPADQLDQALIEARDRVLTKLIDQHLISQQAAQANIGLSDTELEQNYTRNLRKLGLSQQQFLEKLKTSGLTEEKYKKDLRSQLLRDKLIHYEVRSKIIITDEMITEHYAAEYAGKLKDGGYYLLQMGFTWGDAAEIKQSPGLLMADKARARQQAIQVRKQLLDGADFASLARQKSELPSAADGGDIGVFQEDEMASSMREAVVKLEPGEITPILEATNTFQIFKLLSRLQGDAVAQVPLDAVKEEIRKKLFESKFNEEYKNWVEEIKKGSYVKKML
jgi:peptidyl-prolyl cis-trans isomerase SurA